MQSGASHEQHKTVHSSGRLVIQLMQTTHFLMNRNIYYNYKQTLHYKVSNKQQKLTYITVNNRVAKTSHTIAEIGTFSESNSNYNNNNAH